MKINSRDITGLFRLSLSKNYLLIVVVALLTGIVAVNSFNRDVVLMDAAEYHTLAVNILKGNGYSLDQSAPYKPTFYREPGFVISLLPPLALYSFFDDPEYIERPGDMHLRHIRHGSVETIKYFQVMLFALICALQFATLRHVLDPKTAAICALATALFLPLATYATWMMRELVLTLYLMAMNFFLVKYYFEHRLLSLGLAGVFAGLAALSLQVMIFSALFVLAFVVYANRGKIRATVPGYLIFLAMLALTLIPWLYRTYSHYPDIRVVKTIGTNLTYEKMAYINSLRALRDQGLISQQEVTDIEYKTYENSLQGFEDTFSGKYRAMADSNNALASSARGKWRSLTGQAAVYAKRYARHVLGTGYLLSFVRRPAIPIGLKMPMYALSFVLGVFYLAGIVSHAGRLLPCLTVFAFMAASVLFLVGRRLLPIYPYYVTFTVLGILWIRKTILAKIKPKTMQKDPSGSAEKKKLTVPAERRQVGSEK